MSDAAPPPVYSVDTNTFMDWQARYCCRRLNIDLYLCVKTLSIDAPLTCLG